MSQANPTATSDILAYRRIDNQETDILNYRADPTADTYQRIDAKTEALSYPHTSRIPDPAPEILTGYNRISSTPKPTDFRDYPQTSRMADKRDYARARRCTYRLRDPSRHETKKDVQFNDVDAIREYDKEDYEIEDSPPYPDEAVEYESDYRTREELCELPIARVKDFMADFEEDEEYYEDDYDYGESLNNSHRVKSESILGLHYSSELACLRQRERSDSILNIDYTDDMDKSDRSLRTLRLRNEAEYENHSLRVDFEGIDYRDEISDYENEIIRDELDSENSNTSKGPEDIEIDDKIRSLVRSSATLDRLSAVNPYDRSVSRFGSRSRLEIIPSSVIAAPCRRVHSSDAVWLASTPVHGKKYKSNDEMMKKRQVVRFE